VKTLQLLVRGRPVTVSTDRVGPANTLNEPTTGATSTRQSQHPRPQHHQPRHHNPSQKPHAPDVAIISLLASTSEQASPRGGG
jgi:hypothetical protein